MQPNRFMADISSNNSHFDARAYAEAGHIAVAIKATEGRWFIDPDHRAWCMYAHSEHLAVVHYHFARPDHNYGPVDEANWFADTVRANWSGRDYVVLDLERATPQGWSHDPAYSRDFDHQMQVRGFHDLILYASRSVLDQSDQWLEGQDRAVWDADWSTYPTTHPGGYRVAFRQYTDGHLGPEPHSYAGIGNCDGNRIDPQLYARMLARAKCPC